MGRKNRIFKGNLKASQILAVLMLIDRYDHPADYGSLGKTR